ncbi:MAG: hypothetical protein HOP11_15350 [Saprospiraceae bacterium]|nr:hypothetical protein [Saprospiraceae bacterium]
MSKNLSLDFQRKLVSTLEYNCAERNNLIEILIEILNCARSTAYKKVNLKLGFSIDEIIIIARHFDLSLDFFMSHKSRPVPFLSDALIKLPEKSISYIQNILNHLHFLTKLPNVSYTYLAGEVPIFHYMAFKKLMMFKLFVWQYASWGITSHKNLLDIGQYINDKELILTIETCIHTFYQFSGVEIWNIRMIDTTLDQIQYFIPMQGYKNKHEIMDIFYELEELVSHLENICISATKRIESKEMLNKSKVKIYMNELVHSNDSVLITSDVGNMLFTSIDNPNYIRTNEERMIKHIEAWINKTILHSTNISGESEKQRRILFTILRQKLDKGKLEIENLIKTYYS